MATFGDLRSLLQQPPSTALWDEVTPVILELRGLDAQSSEAFNETILPYCLESLTRWPDDLYREVPDSWAELWRKGQGVELVDLCHSELGSFYFYARCAGSGSVVMSSCFWSPEMASLRDEVDAFAQLFETDPEGAEIDTDALWQDGHRLVTFWEGVEVHNVDLNNHWIFEKWMELRGLRSVSHDHEEWRGEDGNGAMVEVAYDELLDATFDARPGEIIARVAWSEVNSPSLEGRIRHEPMTLREEICAWLEDAANFTLFEAHVGEFAAMEPQRYFG